LRDARLGDRIEIVDATLDVIAGPDDHAAAAGDVDVVFQLPHAAPLINRPDRRGGWSSV